MMLSRKQTETINHYIILPYSYFFYKLKNFVHNNVKLHKFLLWDGSMITYDERGYSCCWCISFGY